VLGVEELSGRGSDRREALEDRAAVDASEGFSNLSGPRVATVKQDADLAVPFVNDGEELIGDQ
jgi:hypothetical protein